MKQAKKNYESPKIVEALFGLFDVLTTSSSEPETPPSYDEGDWDIND